MLSIGVFIAIVIIGLVLKSGWRPGFNIPWVSILVVGGIGFLFYRGCVSSGGKTETPSESKATTHHVAPTKEQHPKSGSGIASKTTPLRVWVNPRYAGMYASADVKYCVEGHPTLCVIDRHGVVDPKALKTWRHMPEGWYLITPIGEEEEVGFRWD